MSDFDDFAQRQRDELRGTVMGRRITAAPVERDWPDVPANRCDGCGTEVHPETALCNLCADQHLRTEKENR